MTERAGIASSVVISARIDDLAFYDGGAVARPTNASLEAITALMRRVELAGGEALRRQLRVSEPLAVGSAVVTGAGDLATELLIHGVVASDTEHVTASTVRRATLSALERAADWRVERLGFALFGLGAGNLDSEESARTMVDAIAQHAERGRLPAEITFVVERDDERVDVERAVAWRRQ